MRAYPWLIGSITLLLGFLLYWTIDSVRYNREMDKENAYERMVSI